MRACVCVASRTKFNECREREKTRKRKRRGHERNVRFFSLGHVYMYNGEKMSAEHARFQCWLWSSWSSIEGVAAVLIKLGVCPTHSKDLSLSLSGFLRLSHRFISREDRTERSRRVSFVCPSLIRWISLWSNPSLTMMSMMLTSCLLSHWLIHRHSLQYHPYDQDQYLTSTELMMADNLMLDFESTDVSVAHLLFYLYLLDELSSMRMRWTVGWFVVGVSLGHTREENLANDDEVNRPVLSPHPHSNTNRHGNAAEQTDKRLHHAEQRFVLLPPSLNLNEHWRADRPKRTSSDWVCSPRNSRRCDWYSRASHRCSYLFSHSFLLVDLRSWRSSEVSSRDVLDSSHACPKVVSPVDRHNLHRVLRRWQHCLGSTLWRTMVVDWYRTRLVVCCPTIDSFRTRSYS